MLDETVIRVGNDCYFQENGTIGLATLQEPTYANEVTYTEQLSETRFKAEDAKKAMSEVMTHPDLSYDKKTTRWRLKEHNIDNEVKDTPEWLLSLTKMIASLLEYSLWLLVGAAIIALYIFRKHWLPLLVRHPEEEVVARPDVLFGMDVRKESLPSDIPTAAKQLWDEKKHREALSLLYRGALVTLINDDELALEHNHTEGDILNLSRPTLSASRYQYLSTLTQHWVAIAYAHKTPSDESIAYLFTHWSSDFAASTEAEQ